MIGNGGKVACKGKYHNINLTMGYYQLESGMYTLPLGGCDVILGARWLMILGPILCEFY